MEQITFEQFEAVDIRMGTVVTADVPEWSHWVIKLKVDLGPSFAKASEDRKTMTCFSGIMKFYKPKDLVGKQFPFVVNLKPKTIGPDKELSEVMMLMACPEDPSTRLDSTKREAEASETPTVLFQLQEKVANGTKVR